MKKRQNNPALPAPKLAAPPDKSRPVPVAGTDVRRRVCLNNAENLARTHKRIVRIAVIAVLNGQGASLVDQCLKAGSLVRGQLEMLEAAEEKARARVGDYRDPMRMRQQELHQQAEDFLKKKHLRDTMREMLDEADKKYGDGEVT